MEGTDNKPTGPADDGKANQTDEAAAQAAADAATKADTLAKFGMAPENDGGDPGKTGDADQKTGDPDGETTSKSGPGDDGKGDGKPQEGEKIFGKYESIEAAELGHKNLVTHQKTIETENKKLRQQVADLEKGREESKAGDGSDGTTPKEKYLANPAFKRAYEADVQALGEDAAKARLERDIEQFNQTESSKSDDNPKVRKLVQESMERQLVSTYPELEPGGEAREGFDKLLEQFQETPSEEMMMGIMAKASLFERVPQLIDDAIKRTRAQVLKEIKEKGIANTLTADSTTSRSPEDGGGSLAEKKKDALSRFLPEDHPLMRS